MTKHIPVLLSEVLEIMALKPGMTVVDATLGGGGYGQAFVDRIGPGGMYIGIDRDPEAIERAERSEWVSEGRKRGVIIILIQRNFCDLLEVIRELDCGKADAIVADLGISSDQLEDIRRGLSFLADGPLDMRLDRSCGITAGEIVNTWSAEDIEKIVRENAEEKNAYRISKAIEKERERGRIETTRELAEIVRSVVGGRYQKRRIHPATKTFMALRMAVNEEMKSLSSFLIASIEVLRSGGRTAIVSFHSGEDRVVKTFFREQSLGCVCPAGFPICRCGQTPKIRVITKRVITPKEKEILYNPRSRSSRLRAVEKI